MDTAGVPFIKEWGRQSDPVWSPDGAKLAFVSTRENHAFIGVYDVKTRKVDFLAPSTDMDGGPVWSPDSKRIAFIRRPGTPFGQQVAANATERSGGGSRAGGGGGGGRRGGRGGGGGAGGAEMPAGPSGCPAGGGGAGGRGGAAAGFNNGGRGAEADTGHVDGLCRAAFPGGYTISFMIADVATGKAKEFWHNQPNDRTFNGINSFQWADDHVVFTAQRPNDEWDRYFSVSIDSPQPEPVLLTTTDGLINDSVADRTFVDDRVLEGRQDVLLLHERQGHREAAHLGGADVGRHAGSDLDRRRRRGVADAARVRKADGRAVLQRRAAGVDRHRARRPAAARRSSSRR